MPSVSVVIPSNDRASFLTQAIRSVLDQTYDDFMVLVVDECLSDDAREVVHSFNDEGMR